MTRDEKLILKGKAQTIHELSDRIRENIANGLTNDEALALAAKDTILDEPNHYLFSDIEPETRAFEFVPSSGTKSYLPFPHTGDTIWIGDDIAKVIVSEFTPLSAAEVIEEHRATGNGRYAEIKVIAGIN